MVSTVENVVLCSFANCACSPLLQGFLHDEELCKAPLTCRFSLDVVFLCHDRAVVFLFRIFLEEFHCCNVLDALPSWNCCNSMEGVVMGDKHRYRNDTS